jgi:hypothetical protein
VEPTQNLVESHTNATIEEWVRCVNVPIHISSAP